MRSRVVTNHSSLSRTIAYLWAGVAAPIVLTTVYLIDDATRPGYDPLRHQVSLLSLGDRGWVQTLSFLVTGALLVVFAIGLRDWLRGGPFGRATPAAMGATGVGLLLAGIFPTQPLFGYPTGTPEGMATEITPVPDVTGLLQRLALLAGFGWVLAVALWAIGSLRAQL